MAHPVVIILFFVLSASAIMFFSYSKNYSENRVKGVSNSLNTSGFSVDIKSSDTWDFVEYLCSDINTCSKNSTISGGSTDLHELVIMKDNSWDNINYLKIFVKPSWGSINRKFSLTINSNFAEATTITDSGVSYDALLLPTKGLDMNFADSIAVFSDQTVK